MALLQGPPRVLEVTAFFRVRGANLVATRGGRVTRYTLFRAHVVRPSLE